MRQLLENWGFNLDRLRFALVMACASSVALFAAWAMGLEHPQWAAMSVWASSQPLRGQLLEKGLMRFLGTIVGTIAGVVLVLASAQHQLLLIGGLAIWIGLVTWFSNLQRGLLGYGVVLAGYSASMVSLLDGGAPDHVWLLGLDRMATVLVGVLCATVLGYAFAKVGARDGMRGKAVPLLARTLRLQADAEFDRDAARKILAQVALIDEGLDSLGAGSMRSRKVVRATRRVLLTLMPLSLRPIAALQAQATLLEQAAAALDQGDLDTARARLGALELCGAAKLQLQDLRGALGELIEARDSGAGGEQLSPMPLHRDLIGAREAGLRAGGTLLFFGLIWYVTGWSMGAYMLLGISVMISVFSALENPPKVLRYVLVGQIIAGLAALICQMLLWPLAGSEAQMLWMLLPIIFAGTLLHGHNRSVIGALDFHMVFLLLSQPHFPYVADFTLSLTLVLAVVSAPLVALVLFKVIFPIDRKRRRQHVLEMMYNDLADLARVPQALHRRLGWQARFFHRALRLVRLSSRTTPAEETKALRFSRCLMICAYQALEWRVALDVGGLSRREEKALHQALARLQQLQQDPGHVAQSWRRLQSYLSEPLVHSLLEAETAALKLKC